MVFPRFCVGPCFCFLIYINDLNQISTIIKTIMFADDTNLFLSGKNIIEIGKQFNNESQFLCQAICTQRTPKGPK